MRQGTCKNTEMPLRSFCVGHLGLNIGTCPLAWFVYIVRFCWRKLVFLGEQLPFADGFWVRDGGLFYLHSQHWDPIWTRPMQALCMLLHHHRRFILQYTESQLRVCIESESPWEVQSQCDVSIKTIPLELREHYRGRGRMSLRARVGGGHWG